MGISLGNGRRHGDTFSSLVVLVASSGAAFINETIFRPAGFITLVVVIVVPVVPMVPTALVDGTVLFTTAEPLWPLLMTVVVTEVVIALEDEPTFAVAG